MTVRPAEREARAWMIDVAALLREPGSRRRVAIEGHLFDLAVSGSAIEPEAPISARALLESVTEGILVTASVTAPWHGECRRCLEPATGVIESDVCELFCDTGAEDTYPLGGELLDLAPLVRDACILELPLAPLCSAECRGLCPECGVNRNTESCTCSAPVDPRWAALSSLAVASERVPENHP